MASAEGDMTRQGFTATQALEQMVASEDEGPEEDVSEEEDGEEYDPEHDDAVDDEEAPDVADARQTTIARGTGGPTARSTCRRTARSRGPRCPVARGKGRRPVDVTAVAGPTAQAAAGACDRLGVQPVHHAACGGDRPGGHEPRGLSATRRRLARDGRGRPACLRGPADPGRCVQVPGEAAACLWDAESGRPIFRATMPLKVFYAYSSLLRFDDRETRPARRAVDKLAAVRELWDEWSARLCVCMCLCLCVAQPCAPSSPGRCPFRQYMPSKPARYGIKAWVCCDARSSYAWKMQV
ncbi:hypothetical protein DPEC_G00189540 [Dallia pectoralis]|uniref:Uncharacterized protein n=1 Tax=Dallia pectoralis TaxID=75939 RepID=A0ACC2GCD9_DALPE|nr:hypothetical protein DPEC_G00189540 [Dallia pectoralis]